MNSLGMGLTAFALTSDTVRAIVTKTSPGCYVLGRSGSDGKFLLRYVGRADTDVREGLLELVGKPSWESPCFKIQYTKTAKDAFQIECTIYHEFRPPENASHPASSHDSGWTCPINSAHGGDRDTSQ